MAFVWTLHVIIDNLLPVDSAKHEHKHARVAGVVNLTHFYTSALSIS